MTPKVRRSAANWTRQHCHVALVPQPGDRLLRPFELQVADPCRVLQRRQGRAPGLGHIVKFQFKTIHGRPPPGNPPDFELVEVKVP
jgi:hypothetical protein